MEEKIKGDKKLKEYRKLKRIELFFLFMRTTLVVFLLLLLIPVFLKMIA